MGRIIPYELLTFGKRFVLESTELHSYIQTLATETFGVVRITEECNECFIMKSLEDVCEYKNSCYNWSTAMKLCMEPSKPWILSIIRSKTCRTTYNYLMREFCPLAMKKNTFWYDISAAIKLICCKKYLGYFISK